MPWWRAESRDELEVRLQVRVRVRGPAPRPVDPDPAEALPPPDDEPLRRPAHGHHDGREALRVRPDPLVARERRHGRGARVPRLRLHALRPDLERVEARERGHVPRDREERRLERDHAAGAAKDTAKPQVRGDSSGERTGAVVPGSVHLLKGLK